jgi:ABC-type transport system involved in multi-copper enzyme maturation permease subunit
VISPIYVALFFVILVLLAILVYWLGRTGNSAGKDLLYGSGGSIFGIALILRAFVALNDGTITLSNTKLGNGTFSRATEGTEFWIYVVFFAGFGVICLSICILVFLDVIRKKLTYTSALQTANHSAS